MFRDHTNLSQDIEQRFNKHGVGQSFILMAPTNDVSPYPNSTFGTLSHILLFKAFSRISKPILDQLSIPLNYPLLLSLLRNHFIESDIMPSLVASLSPSTESQAAKIVTASSAEGYPIEFNIQSNNSHINNTYYSSPFTSSTPIKASNGFLQKITRVLDPYASPFGVSPNKTIIPTIIDRSPRQENKTMTDLVNAEPELSIWKETITEVLNAIMKRLGDKRGAENPSCQNPKPFAILPLNAAFDIPPPAYLKTLRAPFNFALSSHLLAWGISVPTCAGLEDILSVIRKEGSFRIFSHRADLNLTITEREGELRVNNARVVMANRCAGNGCIWIVERLIDPVWGMF